MKSEKNRRRQILISKKFQHGFILDHIKIIIFCIIFIGGISVLYYYFRYQFGDSIFKSYLLTMSKGETIKIRTIFKIVTPIITILLVVLIAFTAIIISVFGLYYSHRIAGPVYRLEKTIESICNKDFSLVIRLRTKDKFQEIAEYLNKLIDFLNQENLIVKKFNNSSGKKIKEMKDLLSASPKNIENAKKIITEIEEINLELNRYLKEIKIRDIE